MAELPIAPGEVYIEVEYDYEYKSKDRLINIRQGDCYMLVKKTNEDWWQVKKEEGTKAFYVPAQYVREVRKALMPPLKPVPHPPAASGHTPPQVRGVLWVRPTNLELGLQDHPAENLQRHESASHPRRSPRVSPPSQRRHSSHRHAPTSPTTPTEHDRALHDVLVHGGGHKPRGSSSTLPRSRARSPDMPRDVDGTQPFDSAEEERRTNDSESGEELSSSSTEHLQNVLKPRATCTASSTRLFIFSPPSGSSQVSHTSPTPPPPIVLYDGCNQLKPFEESPQTQLTKITFSKQQFIEVKSQGSTAVCAGVGLCAHHRCYEALSRACVTCQSGREFVNRQRLPCIVGVLISTAGCCSSDFFLCSGDSATGQLFHRIREISGQEEETGGSAVCPEMFEVMMPCDRAAKRMR
ncbi:unnamed protein product [Pleuronectes platessa]|uniref:SH3 domain-containing protein n=1 Tax=Pleuronectes platessa TaxID=8262 RepID=A0A9N7U0Z6_PLEPL|nr:unnamed protein product [Pleuronectes platessa]